MEAGHSREREVWLTSSGLTREPAKQETAKEEERAAETPRRILVVDDSKDARESMAVLLRDLGHVAQTAPDGETALARAVDFQPHVMLLDIVMPGMSGFRVAEKVRADPVLWDTVLITLTGWDDDMDAWLSHHAGCDYHLTKPLDVGLLEAYLKKGRRKFGEA
jgi:CheY-like chemotaxis protein